VEIQLPSSCGWKEDSALDAEIVVKEETDQPLSVPSCIPRYLDPKRQVLTLSPLDVSVKFLRDRTANSTDLPGSQYLVSNLLASNQETFSRILLASDIEKLRKNPQQTSGQINCATLVDGAVLTDVTAAENLLLPKNTLIIRHPLVRVGDTGQRHFVFPSEKG